MSSLGPVFAVNLEAVVRPSFQIVITFFVTGVFIGVLFEIQRM
jgi:hypothetical protein